MQKEKGEKYAVVRDIFWRMFRDPENELSFDDYCKENGAKGRKRNLLTCVFEGMEYLELIEHKRGPIYGLTPSGLELCKELYRSKKPTKEKVGSPSPP